MNSILKQVELVLKKRFSASERRTVLNRWGWDLIHNGFYASSIADSERELSTLLLALDKQYRTEGDQILLEALRRMLLPEVFSEVDLNRFLKENQLPYFYVVEETSMMSGSFHKEVKPEKTQELYEKVFISHSCKDRVYAEAITDFLTLIGIPDDKIFCSSIPEYHIPLDEDIYGYIKHLFTEKKVYVLFLLSENYYSSTACLNEMGAAWVLQTAYTSLLLPGFEFKDIQGAVKAGRISIKLDGNEDEVHSRMIELRDKLQAGFDLRDLDEIRWSRRVKQIESRLREKSVE